MKHAKKLLALLLAFVMAFGMGVSALATEAPRIVTHPQNQKITHGESCTLSVDVYVPAGWAAEYQWLKGYPPATIHGETGESLRLSPGDSFYPPGKKYYISAMSYECMITLRDGDGTVLRLDSHSATVYAHPTLGWRIAGFLLSAFEFLTFPFRFLFYIFFAWE